MAAQLAPTLAKSHGTSAGQFLTTDPHVNAPIDPVHGGWAPLHYACAIGNITACKALLDEGADANKPAQEGQKCLHLAARFGHAAVAELILIAGVDVDGADQNGFTALHYASAFGHIDVAQILVKYGAKVDAADIQGKTPQALASEGRQPQVAEYLDGLAQGRTSCARLRDWLYAIGLGAYYNAFLAQGFDDIDFLASAGLTETDLDAVGVVLAGHRSKLLQVYRIHDFTQAAAVPAATTGDSGSNSDDSSGDSSDESGSGSDSDASE